MRLIQMAALVACLFTAFQPASAEGYDPKPDLDWFVEIFIEPDSIARLTPDGDGGERRTVQLDVGAVSVSFEIHTVAGSMACVVEHTELYRASPLVQFRDEGCDGNVDRLWHATDHGRVELEVTDIVQQQYVKSVGFFTYSFNEMLRIVDPAVARNEILALANDANTRRANGMEYETRLREIIESDGAGGPAYREHGYQVRFFGNGVTAMLRYDHVPNVGLRLFGEQSAGEFTILDVNGDHMPDIMQQPGGQPELGVFRMVDMNQSVVEAGTAHMLHVLYNLATGEVWFMTDDTPGS